MAKLITQHVPQRWEELEEVVRDILADVGMNAERQVRLDFPRAGAVVDVLASEVHEGITTWIICECKNWSRNIPQDVVQSFRTVMQESGAHRGYVISKLGFQIGAVEAARSTTIELVTFEAFQDKYFDKWLAAQRWVVEREVKGIHSYYEPPFGIPGMDLLNGEDERAQYCVVWRRYEYIVPILLMFSPYVQRPPPLLPLDISSLEADGVVVPDDLERPAFGSTRILRS
jgi:Restriction endonuclease